MNVDNGIILRYHETNLRKKTDFKSKRLAIFRAGIHIIAKQ